MREIQAYFANNCLKFRNFALFFSKMVNFALFRTNFTNGNVSLEERNHFDLGLTCFHKETFVELFVAEWSFLSNGHCY